MLSHFPHGLESFNGFMRGGTTVHQALVLDSEKGELVKAPAGVGKKEKSEAKALAALKNHSEAERRRRERINAHLATLRGFVPSFEKMDKATLHSEVVNQVKELEKIAVESSKGLLIPMEGDDLKVESYNSGGATDGTLFFKASLCCNYRPELLSDIRQTIDSLRLKTLGTEVSTLPNRLKMVFIFTTCRNKNAAVNAAAAQLVAACIHQALGSVVEKGSESPEYSPRTTLPNKRSRMSLFDSSSSSS